MWQLRSVILSFLVLLLFSSAASVIAQGFTNRTWLTLTGNSPLVIARGGFSGIFADSSIYAYDRAVRSSLGNVHLWCDVQLTKDGAGICFPDLLLQNASDIENVHTNKSNIYTVNGKSRTGWFSVDFTFEDLTLVNMIQRINSRPPYFDRTQMNIYRVEDVVKLTNPPGLWLNIQYNEFLIQHNLSMKSFIIAASRRVVINYISSPEISFLRSIASLFRTGRTKLIFQFLGTNELEPSTNQTYGSLLNNLTLIKTFATGILVPKYYIQPVDDNFYLKGNNSLVWDAHGAGLEIFASDFANDAQLPYDFSYDPVNEYLSYIDGQFSVDGVLSDYPLTPSAAIDCFSHMSKNEAVKAKFLVISSEGASGDYPGCTDKAYDKAVSDGADIIDCPVQMTSNGIPFCLGSINLKDRTDVIKTEFGTFMTSNPDLNINDGIFTYNLTWDQIQHLKPAIFNPYIIFPFYRNPRAANDGNLMQLSDFLAFASNASSISGVMIGIENAKYLAEKHGLDVIGAVLDALSKAGYNDQTEKKIMIKSTDSAVLSKFKSNSKYELVYHVDENVRDILNSTILEIKKFASSVIVSKRSVYRLDQNSFLYSETAVVSKLHAFGLPVYVKGFRNEIQSQPWDFLSDPYMEINQYVSSVKVDGVIVDFPRTADRYKRNRCLGYKERVSYMTPVEPGSYLSFVAFPDLSPAEAPSPVLSDTDVIEPPLPPVTRPSIPDNSPSAAAGGPPPPNGQPSVDVSTIMSVIAILIGFLWSAEMKYIHYVG